MKKLNQLTIFKIKKFLQEKGYKISKKNKIIPENFSSFYKIK